MKIVYFVLIILGVFCAWYFIFFMSTSFVPNETIMYYIPTNQEFVEIFNTPAGFKVVTTKRQPDHQAQTYSVNSVINNKEEYRIVEMFNAEEEPF